MQRGILDQTLSRQTDISGKNNQKHIRSVVQLTVLHQH